MAGKKPRLRSDDVAVLAATTACASILVNIAQALEIQGTKRQSAALQKDRDHLIEVLSAWQKSHGELRIRLDRRERELAATLRDLAGAHDEARRQRMDLDRLRAENDGLRSRLSNLEAQASSSKRKAKSGSNV